MFPSKQRAFAEDGKLCTRPILSVRSPERWLTEKYTSPIIKHPLRGSSVPVTMVTRSRHGNKSRVRNKNFSRKASGPEEIDIHRPPVKSTTDVYAPVAYLGSAKHDKLSVTIRPAGLSAVLSQADA